MKRGLGLPTMDPQCLAVQTFCKMIDRRVNTVEDNSIVVRMDVNREDNKIDTYYGVDAIIEQLKGIQPQFGIDSSLSKKNRAKMVAAKSMVLNKLLPCVQHYLWINELNYPDVKKEFCEGLPLYKRLFGPYSIHRSMKAEVARKLSGTIAGDGSANHLYREYIYSIATQCISELNTLLYGKKFLFSDDLPCSLDAIVYGCLAFIYYPDELTDTSLKCSLKNYVYVTRFVDSMTEAFYPNSPTMKPQHIVNIRTSVDEIREQRLALNASYTKSVLFLIGSLIAVAINFFPGWQAFYLIVRNVNFVVLEGVEGETTEPAEAETNTNDLEENQ